MYPCILLQPWERVVRFLPRTCGHQINSECKEDCGHHLHLCNSIEMTGLGNSLGVHMWAWEDFCWGVSLVGAERAKLGLEILAVAARTNALGPFPQVRGESSIKGHWHPTAAFWSTSLSSGERGKSDNDNFMKSGVLCLSLRVGQKITF